jgi:F-box and WD-40 domain protein CDC4
MQLIEANEVDSRCVAVLQGHTSLVGQLQMRNDILVTGGSDGSVRVWSLSEFQAIHRLAAHDNSVTSLQFDDARIVSGGSDGRVKIWDLKKGTLVRELSQPADAVWRVVFEEEKAVLLANRNQKTVMEVSSPYPPIAFCLCVARGVQTDSLSRSGPSPRPRTSSTTTSAPRAPSACPTTQPTTSAAAATAHHVIVDGLLAKTSA